MLEIGFGHKIPRLNFVSDLKISQENLRKESYDQTYHKKVEKSGKTLISCLTGKIPYFRVFPFFGGKNKLDWNSEVHVFLDDSDVYMIRMI